MKALQLVGPSTFKVVDKALPEISSSDVLIKVKACGICGSHIYGSSGRRIPPVVMGHEASGVIQQIGANVANLNVGDRVTFDSTVFCNDCDYCNQGRVNLCDNRQVMRFRLEGLNISKATDFRSVAFSFAQRLSGSQGLKESRLTLDISMAV